MLLKGLGVWSVGGKMIKIKYGLTLEAIIKEVKIEDGMAFMVTDDGSEIRVLVDDIREIGVYCEDRFVRC